MTDAVLIVEDDHDTRVEIRNALEDSGYYVLSATNGFDALEILKNITPPCLILLDLRMPIYNGWEFLELKAKSEKIAQIPIIAISTNENLEKIKDPQVVDFISKPLDLSLLCEKVAKYCKTPVTS